MPRSIAAPMTILLPVAVPALVFVTVSNRVGVAIVAGVLCIRGVAFLLEREPRPGKFHTLATSFKVFLSAVSARLFQQRDQFELLVHQPALRIDHPRRWTHRGELKVLISVALPRIAELNHAVFVHGTIDIDLG